MTDVNINRDHYNDCLIIALSFDDRTNYRFHLTHQLMMNIGNFDLHRSRAELIDLWYRLLEDSHVNDDVERFRQLVIEAERIRASPETIQQLRRELRDREVHARVNHTTLRAGQRAVDPPMWRADEREYRLRHLGCQRYEQAEARSIELLKANLTKDQLACYNKYENFFTIGCHTKHIYRIRQARSMNVDWVEKDRTTVRATYCFLPQGSPPVGDIMLAQKIALEHDETAALNVANVRPMFTATEIRRRAGTSFIPGGVSWMDGIN